MNIKLPSLQSLKKEYNDENSNNLITAKSKIQIIDVKKQFKNNSFFCLL